MTPPSVGVVIVSFNTREHLLGCLDALFAPGGRPLQVTVVDNASGDGSAAAVRARFPDVKVVENETNVGFARANNAGLAETTGDYVLVLNSDCEMGPGALDALCAILDARRDVGVVGPRTVGTDGRPQVSFGPALTPRAEWRQRRLVRGVKAGDAAVLREVDALAGREAEPDWVSASCLLARRAALEAVGGFDASFFLYEEDVDLCLRVREAGWRVVYTPAAIVRHHLGRSMEQAAAVARLEYHRSHLRLYRKHNPLWQQAVLRAWMAGQSVGRILRAGGGDEGRRRRAAAGGVLRLALFG